MNIKHIFACALLLFPVTTSLGASFSDVPESSPSYAAVESLKNLLIITGILMEHSSRISPLLEQNH